MNPSNEKQDDLSSFEKSYRGISGFFIIGVGLTLLIISLIFYFLLKNSPLFAIGAIFNWIIAPLGLVIVIIGIFWQPIYFIRKKMITQRLINDPNSTELIVSRLIQEGSDYDLQGIKSEYIKILERKNWKPSSDIERIWFYIAKNEWNELFSDKNLPQNLISHVIANNFLYRFSLPRIQNIEEITADMHPFKKSLIDELRNETTKHPENSIILLGLIGDDQTIEEFDTFVTRVKGITDVNGQFKYLKYIAHAYRLAKNPLSINSLIKLLDYDIISDKNEWDRSPATISVNTLISLGDPAINPLIKTISDAQSSMLKVQHATSALIGIGQRVSHQQIIETLENAINVESNPEKQKLFKDIIKKLKLGISDYS